MLNNWKDLAKEKKKREQNTVAPHSMFNKQ